MYFGKRLVEDLLRVLEGSWGCRHLEIEEPEFGGGVNVGANDEGGLQESIGRWRERSRQLGEVLRCDQRIEG
jgi:hypothetical protein